MASPVRKKPLPLRLSPSPKGVDFKGKGKGKGKEKERRSVFETLPREIIQQSVPPSPMGSVRRFIRVWWLIGSMIEYCMRRTLTPSIH